jgi:hypothetical protein
MTTRTQLLALTPQRYLANGYRDARGLARAELTTEWAIAAVEQLRAAGITAAALDPIVATAARTHSVTPGAPPAAAKLIRECLAQIKSDADWPPFAQHLAAVLALLALAESTVELNRQPTPRN